jgi:hypothetical protein
MEVGRPSIDEAAQARKRGIRGTIKLLARLQEHHPDGDPYAAKPKAVAVVKQPEPIPVPEPPAELAVAPPALVAWPFEPANPGPPGIDKIQNAVARHYGTTRMELISGRRTAAVIRPRHVAMYLAKTLTSRSFPHIGRRFGNRDHTTIMHAAHKIGELIKTVPELAADVAAICRALGHEGAVPA